MKLYTKAGWLDVPHINEVADRNNISIIIIIGKRQIGKTYGVLKFMLDDNKRFILLRSVMAEMDMLKHNVASPFDAIKGYSGRVVFESETQYTANIVRIDTQDDIEGEIKTSIGMLSALSAIGRVRGINGRQFSDVVYDEFIPESHLLKVKNGGDAFLNMYTTIAGNREIEGEKPLRVWLLANSNNLDNDILNALNITEVVEKMSLRGEESRILKDRGIMLILPDSQVITEKRKKGALYRAIGGDSKFAKMAYENNFSYNDFSDVNSKPLEEYNPIIMVYGESNPTFTIYLHKTYKTLYVVQKVDANARHTYYETERDKMKFTRDFPEIKAAYLRGRFSFQNMTVKNQFLNYLGLA